MSKKKDPSTSQEAVVYKWKERKKNVPPVSYTHVLGDIISHSSRTKLNVHSCPQTCMWQILLCAPVCLKMFPQLQKPPQRAPTTVYYQQHLNPFDPSSASSCSHLLLFISLFIHLSTVYTWFLLTLHLHLPLRRALGEQRPSTPRWPPSNGRDD